MALRAIHRKLLRDFWHLRGQALAIAMVIAGGIATWIISYSTIESLERTQASFYRESRFADVFALAKRAPARLEKQIAALPGVRTVETRTVGAATVELPFFEDPVTGQLVGLPDQGNATLNRLYLRSGRLPAPRSPKEVVISEPFAEAHGLGPGDDMTAVINGRRQELRIVGVGLSAEYIYQIAPGALFPDYERYVLIWMREEPLAAAWDTRDGFNSVTLTLERGTEEAEVIDRLDALLRPYGGTGAYGRDDQVSHKYLKQEIAGLQAMAGVVPIIFLGVAAFLINVVITRIVEQQRDQIAILKAFGYGNPAVGWHYAQLVLLIMTGGLAAGIGAGTWLGHGLAELYRDFFRFPYLEFYLGPDVVLSATLVAMAAALGGAMLAVRRAILLPPAEAMRPEPPAVYRATLVERLGAQRLFDQPSRMILRHLERKPVKALLSVLGIAMAEAILFVGMFQEDAIAFMMDVQFNLAQREDLTITFTEPTERRALFELQALDGVMAAEPFRAVPVRLRHGHRSHRTSIQGFERGAELHRVLDAKQDPVRLPGTGVLLTDYLGRKLEVKAGDSITVEVLEGAQPVRQVRVAGLASEFIGVSAYMEISGLNRLMEEGPVLSGIFLAVDSTRQRAVLDDLKDRPRVAGITIQKEAIQAFYETLAETLLIFAFINTLLAGSIAFGVVYNSSRIAFSEHSRELASLRVLGFTRGEISYILLGELAVMTLAAIPFGFLIGWEFTRLIAASLASELYRIPVIIETSTYGFVATMVVAAAVISALIMRRKLYRLDLVAVLKTRE